MQLTNRSLGSNIAWNKTEIKKDSYVKYEKHWEGK